MRLFIALDIPDDVRSAIATVVAKLRRACEVARWVHLEGAHVTLKFIGEVPAETAGPIKAALATVPFPGAIKIFFRDIGFFPNEHRPRVLWAGAVVDPELRTLAEAVENSLEPLGLAREQREFSPHVTLARFKSPEKLDGLRAAVAAAGPLEFGGAVANEFHLYQSILKPGGAEYTRLATFNQAGSN
jgi:RNA 2',3'-cyclic 3'-phosphodiesterase